MRKLSRYILAGVLLVAAITICRAMVVKYNTTLVNEPGLAYNNTYPLALNTVGIDYLSFTAITSSVTFTAQTFTDGQASTGTITVSSSPTAGIKGELFCINSICIQDGGGWAHDPGGTSSSTAWNIKNAINADSRLSQIVIASVTFGQSIVFTTATAVGINYAVYSSSQAALTIGGSTVTVTGLAGAGAGQMWGGVAASFSISSPYINIANSNFTRGLPVLYAAGTVAIAPLVTQTTYYVIPVTPGTIELALTSTGAIASVPIIITSSATPTAKDTYTLTPGAILGNTSYKWQVSNDAINWFDYLSNQNGVAISSVTIATYISTGTVSNWDFGPVNYAWIRLSVTSPTQGAVNIKVYGNGKNSTQ
jgi:hypothetical protein